MKKGKVKSPKEIGEYLMEQGFQLIQHPQDGADVYVKEMVLVDIPWKKEGRIPGLLEIKPENDMIHLVFYCEDGSIFGGGFDNFPSWEFYIPEMLEEFAKTYKEVHA